MAGLVGDKYPLEHVSECNMSDGNYAIFAGRIERDGSIDSTVTYPTDTPLPFGCSINFGTNGGFVEVKIDETSYEIKSISDLPGRDRVLRPCDSETLDWQQRRLYKKFTDFLLSSDVKFRRGFVCSNNILSYGNDPYKIRADRPVPLVLSKFDNSYLQQIACAKTDKFRLARSTGVYLLHITSEGDRTLFQYRNETVVYVGVLPSDNVWVQEMRDDQEKRLRLQYHEAIRRCEMEDEELSMQDEKRSLLPKLRSYPDMEDNGLFDEWNQFLDLFRDIVNGWPLPACAATHRLTPGGPCPERHIPGQCLDIILKIMTRINRDWEDYMEVESHDSGHGAFTDWACCRDRWRDTSNFKLCIDVRTDLKTGRMMRRAQDTCPDVGGMSRLISASREFTTAAVFGTRHWMKDYSYFCFLGKGERSRPIVKELTLTVRDIRPYAFFTSLHDQTTISTEDLRFCSGAEMQDGVWHCTQNETVRMAMQLEDRIAGTTN